MREVAGKEIEGVVHLQCPYRHFQKFVEKVYNKSVICFVVIHVYPPPIVNSNGSFISVLYV